MSKPTELKASDDDIAAFIKIEVDAQRAMLTAEIAAEIEARMRDDVESRVAEKVREILRSTTSRGNGESSPAPAVYAPRSTGWEKPARYSGVDIGEPGAAWVRAMEEHLRLLREYDPLMTESMVISIVISFTDSIARDFAIQMRDELGGRATWAKLKSELMDRFGVAKSPLQLLRDLRDVKQGQSSVAVYTNTFESRLSFLVAAGSTDSLTAMNYYMEGMSAQLHAVLYRSFLVMSENPLDVGVKLTPREAVRTIARLARRCEEIELALAPKAPTSAVRAAVAQPVEEVVEPRVAVARTNARRGRGGQPSASREPPFTRVDLVSHLARKHDVPRAIVEHRLDNNLCARCAGDDHTARICDKPVVKTATSANVPAPQPTNQRAH